MLIRVHSWFSTAWIRLRSSSSIEEPFSVFGISFDTSSPSPAKRRQFVQVNERNRFMRSASVELHIATEAVE